jgi:hypothetical protein
MVKREEYAALVRAIEQCGATAFIGADEYLAEFASMWRRGGAADSGA